MAIVPLAIGLPESVFLLVMCVFTIFGNVTVIVTIFRHPLLHNSFNVFIANFAFVGLYHNVLVIPITLAALIAQPWSISKILCVCLNGHMIFTTAILLWSFAAMAVNRYYRVVKPSTFPHIFTTRRSVMAAAAMWIALAVLSIVFLSALLPITEFKLDSSHCFGLKKPVVGALLALFLFVTPPSFITLFFYLKTSWFIKKQRSSILPLSRSGEIRLYAEERKTLRVLLVLLVTSLCCWFFSLTFWLLVELMTHPPGYFPDLETFSSNLLGVVFPIVYIFVSKYYRNELLKIVSCRCCCKITEETGH